MSIPQLLDAAPGDDRRTARIFQLLRKYLNPLLSNGWIAPHVSTPTPSTASGAGSHATVSVVGNDRSGTITVGVSALDTPLPSAVIASIVFSDPWPIVPRVLLTPANDAAASAVAFVRQAEVTVTGFTVRSGPAGLPT